MSSLILMHGVTLELTSEDPQQPFEKYGPQG